MEISADRWRCVFDEVVFENADDLLEKHSVCSQSSECMSMDG